MTGRTNTGGGNAAAAKSLYNRGDEYSAVTGGWERYQGTLTKGSESMSGNASTNGYTNYFGTSQPVDVTGYAKLHFEIYKNTGRRAWIGINTSKPVFDQTAGETASMGYKKELELGEDYAEVVLDITGAENSWYVCFTSSSGSTNTPTMVRRVWLTRE